VLLATVWDQATIIDAVTSLKISRVRHTKTCEGGGGKTRLCYC
jgi:hypothetical protein